jgi:hypothetical protein
MVITSSCVPNTANRRQQTVVVVFVRHPVPGRVKTRLARDLGDEDACGLYRAMVEDCIANVRSSGLPLFLFHDGQDKNVLPSKWVAAADTIFRQEGESLGERMSAAFERSFAVGAVRVILIGSDIPGIDTGLLHSAKEALEINEVVLSPALDGGYCLIASRKDCFNSSIFQKIPWSTSRVLDMTISACVIHGLSYRLLEPRLDIDTMDDLAAYCRKPSEFAPITNAWLVSRGLLNLCRIISC